MFNAKAVKDACVQWIRYWFDKNGSDCKAVIGISGGKDSSVVAALCVEALGRDRVLGVLMPQGEQGDIKYSEMLVRFLGIESITCNIGGAVNGVLDSIEYGVHDLTGQDHTKTLAFTPQTITNLPARVRMATLYAVSQSVNGRVANTCNLSEDWVGYATRYGDAAGDFSPLANLTVTEVKAIGRELGLPSELVDKTPTDGLCGKTDEDNLGFTYDTLDRYIREGICEDSKTKEKIDYLHDKNLFKLKPMPSFKYEKGDFGKKSKPAPIFSWDALYERAADKPFGSNELSAKDEARNQLRDEIMIKRGFDIEECESPEEEIETFLSEENISYYFDENGNMVKLRFDRDKSLKAYIENRINALDIN